MLTAFRRGQVQTLLATNVAARGLDISGIYQVINYKLPESSELFTHRIGRTGRMGQQGKAITLLAPSDIPTWRRMARTLGQAVSLQRLTIDEEATVITPSIHKEVTETASESLLLPERPYADNARSNDRKRERKPSRFERITERQSEHAFATTEPQQRRASRKPGATRARRTFASNRSW